MKFMSSYNQREYDKLKKLVGKRVLSFDGQAFDADDVSYDNVEDSFYVSGTDAVTGERVTLRSLTPPDHGFVDISSPKLSKIIAQWTAERAEDADEGEKPILYAEIVASLPKKSTRRRAAS